MNSLTRVVTLTPANYAEYGCPCFLNPKHPGHLQKLEWLKERLAEGLTIKHLFVEGEKRPIGFIEYVPGEYAWRAVEAGGYVFIHCIWINPNKYKEKGNGSLLVKECINDAERQGRSGVAVVTSSGPHMAGKELFIKNGFKVVAETDRFELLTLKLKGGPVPQFKDWAGQMGNYRGLNIVYSHQCPWVARSIPELAEIAEQHGLDITVTELETAAQAQRAPSIYAVFNLVYNGQLITDHYVSNTRFMNILRKELQLIG